MRFRSRRLGSDKTRGAQELLSASKVLVNCGNVVMCGKAERQLGSEGRGVALFDWSSPSSPASAAGVSYLYLGYPGPPHQKAGSLVGWSTDNLQLQDTARLPNF